MSRIFLNVQTIGKTTQKRLQIERNLVQRIQLGIEPRSPKQNYYGALSIELLDRMLEIYVNELASHLHQHSSGTYHNYK